MNAIIRLGENLRNDASIRPGDEAWAYAFEYANNKVDKAYHQTPIKGQFQNSNTAHGAEARTARSELTVSYFVPYQKNKNKLAWSRAVRIESRNYADTKEEATEAYNTEIALAQAWHTLASIKLNRLYLDKEAPPFILRENLPKSCKPVSQTEFLQEIETGSINEESVCYLSLQEGICLAKPVTLDNTRRVIIIEVNTSHQNLQFSVDYNNIFKMLNYEYQYSWYSPHGTPILYVER